MIQRTLLAAGLFSVVLSGTAHAVDVNLLDRQIMQMWQQQDTLHDGLVQSGLIEATHDAHQGHDEENGMGGDYEQPLTVLGSGAGSTNGPLLGDTDIGAFDSIQREINASADRLQRNNGSFVELNNDTLAARQGGFVGSFGNMNAQSIFEIQPVANARVSSNYGYRTMGGRGEFHPGIDLAAPYGTPIYATGTGTVTYAGWKNGYGNFVVIEHANGYVTRYGHASRILVSVGDRVTKDQQIAAVGCTGRCTGPHLHYEVYKDGMRQNPNTYLAMAAPRD